MKETNITTNKYSTIIIPTQTTIIPTQTKIIPTHTTNNQF
jgi:hypothetical protein